MNWLDWEPQEQILITIQDILQAALTPDNEIQKNVQEKLNVVQGMSDFTNYLLYILCQTSFSDDMRSLSAILLKNNLTSVYGRLPEELIYKIRSECLHLLKDPSRKVRSNISNIIVVICKDNLKTWLELIPHLLKLFYAQDEYSDIAINTLFKICEELIQCHKMHEESYRIIKEVFPKFLEYISDENCNCRMDIVRLTNQFLQDYFQVMKQSIDLDTYLRKIIFLTNSDDIELLKHICHTFVIYMDNQEQSLLPHLHDVIMYLLDKCQHDDPDVALQACEFWLSTSKLENCKEILMPYIDKLLPILLKNMKYSLMELNEIRGTIGNDAEFKDDGKDIYPCTQNRARSDDDDDEEDIYEFDDSYIGWTLRKCSAASLDSIAVKFGDDLLILLIPLLNDILNDTNYLVKESAILALGAIAEGCLNGLTPHLPHLIEFLIISMNDEHSLVRVITCWTLSRYVNWIMILDVPADVYFIPIMTVLLRHFIDDNKRVQRAAISAFCIFQEEAQLKLIPYIDFILDGFQLGIQKFHYRSLYLLYDAIGVLAQSVGNQLNKDEYVKKLMPLLMEKFLKCDNYFDDHFVAVMECLANLIPSLETSFLPYAETVYCHCLQLINDTLLATIRYQEQPFEYDLPDKEPMNVAHDILYSMAIGLKNYFVKYVTNSNLLLLLHKTIQDNSSLIRQTATALYGELIMLCYPYLERNLNDYIPLIINNLDDNYDGVCNNAAWVIGKLCLMMGTQIRPFLPDILNSFLNILNCTENNGRTMLKTIVITLCIIFYICPDINLPNMDDIIMNCCILIRNVRDSDEKVFAFHGLGKMVRNCPEFNKNHFIYYCDAIASFNDVNIELKDEILNVLTRFRQTVGEENWQQFYEQFPDPLKYKLNMLYGV